MVGAHNGRVDVGGFDFVFEGGRYQEVVDAPADVVGPGAAKVRPPGVKAVALVEEAERVDKTGVNEGLEPGSLLGGVAFFAHVGFGTGEVVGGVGHIEIAAENDRLGLVAEGAGFQALAILQEGWVPVLLTQGDAREVIFGVRRVDGYHVEMLELGGEDTALGVGVAVGVVGHVVLGFDGFWQTRVGFERRSLRQDGCAGVAFALG